MIIKTIKELETKDKPTCIANQLDYVYLQALKDILELIDEIGLCSKLEELKSRITG